MDLVRATRQAIERRLSISDFDAVLDMLSGGGVPSYTGKLVSPQNALGIAAVYACCQALADDFASLKLVTNRWIVPGKDHEEARDHYLWSLLQDEVNPRMSAWRFKRDMEFWRQLGGNCYAEFDINGRGQITALWPWRSDRTKVYLVDPNDPRTDHFYVYSPLDHQHEPIVVPSSRMLHIRHMSMDGVIGLSPIQVHRQTMGLSAAMTEHAARFFSNGTSLGGIIEGPGIISDKSEAKLRESLNAYRGSSNAHKMLILGEGLSYKYPGMPHDAAQFIETMGLTAADIARIYKVPQHRIGLLDRATNNNVEQLALEYIQYTLGPNAKNWTGEIHTSMLSGRERQSIYVAPDYSDLDMADIKSRGEFYRAMGGVAAFSPDEIRHREGLNSIEGGFGKFPLRQINTQPINQQPEVEAGKVAVEDGKVEEPTAPAPAASAPPAAKPKAYTNGVAH